ncbi:3-oxoacyl-[acyl-carrier-protein] synthase I, chloroplastic-like protein [Tanacetum coccineum]
MGSALLAIDTGLIRPNYSISTACVTANYCFFNATNHVRRGDADIMVLDETEATVNAIGVGGFISYRALSQRNDESKPTLHMPPLRVLEPQKIMESLEHATKRGANIIVEYLGGSITCDAHHMIDPRKDSLVFILHNQVNYINCHATSTLAGDLAEVNAIKKVFKDTSKIRMNGTKKMNRTKSIIGHGLGAASGLEAIACIKAINTGWLLPAINQKVKDLVHHHSKPSRYIFDVHDD